MERKEKERRGGGGGGKETEKGDVMTHDGPDIHIWGIHSFNNYAPSLNVAKHRCVSIYDVELIIMT